MEATPPELRWSFGRGHTGSIAAAILAAIHRPAGNLECIDLYGVLRSEDDPSQLRCTLGSAPERWMNVQNVRVLSDISDAYSIEPDAPDWGGANWTRCWGRWVVSKQANERATEPRSCCRVFLCVVARVWCSQGALLARGQPGAKG